MIVSGLPSALPASDSVDVFRALRHQSLNRHRLGRRTWLFWEDLAPGAMFSHTSVMLLVDDASGRVLRRRLEWWPLINGRPPPFLMGSKPASRRYVVFSSVKARARAAAAPASARTAQALQISPQNLAHDCLITVGLEYCPPVDHARRTDRQRAGHSPATSPRFAHGPNRST